MKKALICLCLAFIIILTSCDIGLSFNGPSRSPEKNSQNTTEKSTLDSDFEANTQTNTEQGTDKPDDTPDKPTPPSASDDHSDIDDNGICDDCGESVIVAIDFYAINDLHGKFSDTASNIGVDELTTYLKNCRDIYDDYFVFLSSGDMWQGGSESNLTKGLIITDWLNHLGAESMTLGNHEFDWGEEYISANAELAQFPLLAINVYEHATNTLADYCSPSVIIERGGIQIGIIGAIGDCYSSIAPDHTKEIYFKTGNDLTSLVKAESQRLRSLGVDYIVYSIHDGYSQSKSGVTSVSSQQLSSYYDASLSEGGYVDLVFEGHTHANYVLTDSYGVYHLQNGGDNRGISHAEININFANWNSKVNVAEFISGDTYSFLPDDPIVDELREKYKDTIALGDQIIGNNSYYRNSTYLRQLVADLYFEKGLDIWGDKYDISLGGGFISIRSPYHLESGPIKYSQLQSLFPFDNQLVLCSVSGYDLRKKFIETSNTDYFISYEPGFTSNINDSATYYIIVDSYTSTYAPNKLTEIERYDFDIFARDLLADYIASGGMS
ncbi:MAG: bifunctional metallophosphatase/5'-nucleotidase [Ruminococcaceae bacterium]|nr:bifunctional metallophosphatase/5'-nucleotidase [Oscillospiraceae bacterium]